MKIRCIAVDDEPPALKILADYCSRVPYLQLIATTSDPLDAIQKIRNEKPELIFLDIQMPEIDGLSIARNIENSPLFIFSTAHSKYAVEGFNLNAIDFLLKPYDFDRFLKAVLKAKKELELRATALPNINNDFIVVRIDYQNVKIQLSDILYIESLDNYVKIHTPAKNYVTLQSLKQMTTMLPADIFVRVHKSFIVSIPHISHFSREFISIEKHSVPIGRSYVQEFMKIAKDKS